MHKDNILHFFSPLIFHIYNFGPKILHNYNLAPKLLHNCNLTPELLYNYNLAPELLKNSNQVLTVDFSQNSLLLATFRAESGVGLVGPGDGGSFGAMGFARGGRTVTDRGVEASSFATLECRPPFWAFSRPKVAAMGAV